MLEKVLNNLAEVVEFHDNECNIIQTTITLLTHCVLDGFKIYLKSNLHLKQMSTNC